MSIYPELKNPETYQANRLIQVANQSQEFQNEYLFRLSIDKMNRETLIDLSMNLSILKQNDQNQREFRDRTQKLISLRNPFLEQEQKKFFFMQCRMQQNSGCQLQKKYKESQIEHWKVKREEFKRKAKSDYQSKIFSLFALFMVIFSWIFFTFFRREATQECGYLQRAFSDILLGSLFLVGTAIAIISYYYYNVRSLAIVEIPKNEHQD